MAAARGWATNASLLNEAIRHIRGLVDGEFCPLFSNRKKGETCRQAQSRIQGVPCAGCAQCEARDFLARVGTEPRT